MWDPMTQPDPYAILGVPRTASRAEIARAFRRLAKQHHPDAGAEPSPTMSRINEAWYVLSDPSRRARWDRQHSAVFAPPQWRPVMDAAPPGPRVRRPEPPPAAPPSAADRGWVVATGVVIVALLIGAGMMVVSAASAPPETRDRFESDEVAFLYPGDWTLAEGDAGQDGARRVLAHLVSFPAAGDEICRSFADRCSFEGAGVPAGEVSIVVSAWAGGTPPIPEPVVSRPFGSDADAIIGGRPAAATSERPNANTLVLWWQLSPPRFPDRWIEVRAEIGGADRDVEEAVEQVEALLDTIEFRD